MPRKLRCERFYARLFTLDGEEIAAGILNSNSACQAIGHPPLKKGRWGLLSSFTSHFHGLVLVVGAVGATIAYIG